MPTLPPADDDWYFPDPRHYPQSSDEAAIPPSHERMMMPWPQIPPGSAYSPRRNMWLTPDGRLLDAGQFRPMPPDANTLDPSDHIENVETMKGMVEEVGFRPATPRTRLGSI